MGAAWGDYDADGHLDLVVSGFNALRLYRNDGTGLQQVHTFPSPDGFWAGLSWSDFDRDGDLDLYVCGYVQYVSEESGESRDSTHFGRKIPYTLNPASYPPERNLLFVNHGDGRFEEAAVEYGVENSEGRSLAALWHDLNDDGWPDLYVANDISDNALYINREGRLKDESHAAWVADYRGAMGLAVGDWNRDGDDDLFVTHWVAQENALYDSLRSDNGTVATDDGSPQQLHFVDAANRLGLGQVALRSVGWGTEFVDFDADGWLDLVVANGSTFEEEGEPRSLVAQLPFLFWNAAGEFFHDLAPENEALSVPHVARGLAVSDYDNDGDQDLLFIDSGAGVRLLRNEIPQGHWLQLRLRAAAHAPVEGARIAATVGGAVLRRSVSGVSYLSQSSRRIHFGLGEAKRVDALELHWPSGSIDTFAGLDADAIWEITEGDPTPRRVQPQIAVKLSREEVREFWRVQRAAVRAMKVDLDLDAAILNFRQALALDPTHEDSLYFLGNCLEDQGDREGALSQFATLMELNPNSHRAFKLWGTLKAMSAESTAALIHAEEALERAVTINPEATGARMVLAEVGLVRNDTAAATQGLRWVLSTNPTAGDALYLLGYIAQNAGDSNESRELLQRAASVSEEWRPAGVVAEGDVERRMHRETTLLGSAYASWSREVDPESAFAGLDQLLREYRRSP
jgi:tetratricopeptide (TPR) repeat protein